MHTAATAGVVRNPDPYHDDPGIIERRFSISYANYLRAAAKIRGVVGSGRSYSFLGYNCTSFAADIAKEAGVPIKDKDSSETMQTFRYRSARIDSPYSLAKFVRAANKQKDLSKEVYARESALENEMDARVKAGKAHNIIPEKAYMKCSLRSYRPDDQEYITGRVNELVQSIASMYHADFFRDDFL